MRKYRDKCNDKCTMKIFYFQLFGEYDITWLTQINNLLVKSSTNLKKIFLYNRNCKCAMCIAQEFCICTSLRHYICA